QESSAGGDRPLPKCEPNRLPKAFHPAGASGELRVIGQDGSGTHQDRLPVLPVCVDVRAGSRTGDPLARAVRGSSHAIEGASELQRHVRSAQLRGAQPGFNAKTVLPQMEGLEIGAAHGHTRGTQALASPALRLARVSEK